MTRRTIALLMVLLAVPGAALAQSSTERCASIADDRARLECYDKAAPKESETTPGQLSKRWQLDDDTRKPPFTIEAHKQNYFLFGRWTDAVNQAPYMEYAKATGSSEKLDPVEAKFQISLKLKLVQHLLGSRAALWVGYTQQNQWQLYNKEISSPFRETNYEPEAMVCVPTDYSVLGLRGRMVVFAFEHQSNGRTQLLSRSWNRLYAQFGFERGNFAMTLRPWYRLPEDAETDDNPDIQDFYGHGDIVMQYRHARQVFSMMARGNLATGKGAAQLDYTFPMYGGLRGYVQLFSGYGESMIDYNWRQNTIGAGVLLSDWF